MHESYDLYIWPCYILLLVLISWQLIIALKKNFTVRQKLQQSLQPGSVSDQQT